MELPQPRPFGTQGKRPTHDFLSLYGNSSSQHQDPRPSQGNYLKTHDFLQPLERVGKSNAKGENSVEKSIVTKPPRLPPPCSSSSSSVEHVLPGGIGTYSISHISNFSQQVPKPERIIYTVTERNGEVEKSNSNCSSYSGGGFTSWEESVVKEKETMVKDNGGQVTREPAEKLGQWSSERPLQAPFIHRSAFSSPSSSKQSFMEMMKSAKGLQEEEEDDDEEFVLNKEGSSQKGNLIVKVDGKSTDQKANTPRSKHSATEQRRRSKINDRFQILRDLIPHSDQKRDKASFLLEVIEYIQLLQEKVHKYEGSYQGWSQEPTKLMPWRNNHGPIEGSVDHSHGIKIDSGPGLVFAGIDENSISVTPTMLANAQHPVESDLSTAAAFKSMDHHPGLANKAVSLPTPLHPNMFTHVGRGAGLTQPQQRPISDAENMASQPQSQSWQSRPCTTVCPVTSDALNEQELTIEGGTISISSVYCQGLLNTLTQALQTSGVDLSQASISVQIDLGKQANSRLTATTSSPQDNEDPSSNQRMTHSRVASSSEDSVQAQKRLKTEKS